MLSGGGSCDLCDLLTITISSDPYSIFTHPAQPILTADTGSIVDDLYDLYDMYDLYDLCDLYDLYDLYELDRHMSEL